MADNDDIPFNRDFPLEARRGRGGPPRRAAHSLQQSEPVHLHRHGELHRRPGQGRDHRSRSRQRGPCGGAARCRARRDRDAYPRHPHPPRPFAEHRADQGGDRRHRLCRGSAPRVAAALREREAQSGIRRRPRLQARHRGARRRDHRRRGWALEAVATPGHTANHLAFAWPERKMSFRRRSRDGLVDLDRGAAGRIDDRLHGLARAAAQRATRICISPATARKSRTGRAMCAS